MTIDTLQTRASAISTNLTGLVGELVDLRQIPLSEWAGPRRWLSDQERYNGWAHPVSGVSEEDPLVVTYCPEQIAHATRVLAPGTVEPLPGTLAGHVYLIATVLRVEVANWGMHGSYPGHSDDTNRYWANVVLDRTPMRGMLPPGFL